MLSADTIALGFIKSCVFLYDIITYPIYYVVQQPYNTLAKSSAVKARQLDASSPYSAWKHVLKPDTSFVDDCKTVSELFAKACLVYKHQQCFGYRPVLGEEDERQPDGKVFRKLILGDYTWFSFDEINQRVDCVAKGLLKNGIRAKDNVLIFADTRLEWMLSAQALFRIGATVTTLYATLGDDAIVHGMNETEVTHCITNWDLLPKLQRLVLDNRVPYLKCVIYMEGLKTPKVDETFSSRVNVIPFSKVENSGKLAVDGDSMIGAREPTGEDNAVLMYTSGSTGTPKAVMITHSNLLAAVKAIFTLSDELTQQDVYMGFMPLAHVLELFAELFFLSIGMRIGYATPITMTDRSTGIKKGCKGDASLLQPTVMAVVPLILDRIRKEAVEQVARRGDFVKGFFNFAMDYKKQWTERGFRTPLINYLICRKTKAMLGGRIRLLMCGGAPLSSDTQQFIRSCFDVKLGQGYGLTETCGAATVVDLNDLTLGGVGAPLNGIYIKLVDWVEGGYRVTDKPNPRGEIVVGGNNITAGYYKNDSLTKESYIEEDGVRLFYTGDIGEVSADGSLFVIDRKKDLVKLQFGEYVSLGKVESVLKSCPYVDNICVYGHSLQSYIIALVMPNAKALQTLAETLSKQHLTTAQLCVDKEIIAAITKSIQEHALKSKLHKMEIPTKIKLCPEKWSPDSGLLTAALKLRRKNIEEYYRTDINRMYGIVDSV